MENTTIHCHNRFPHRRLAGEKYRESPKECFTGIADEKGYCRGAKYGESCSNNGVADCDVDMFCSEKKVCEHARLEGEYCNLREKCASYLICAWEDGVDHRCRPYGFHTNDQQLGPGDENEICRSHFLNDKFVCEAGPKLTHNNIRDQPGDKCTYTHGENSVAHCWYHSEGKAVCQRGAGELMDEWDMVLNYLGKRPSCHVMLPMAQCDMGREVMPTQEEWEKVWFSISKLHWEHQFEGLLPCMRQFVHPEAFKYHRENSYGGYLTVGLLSLIPLLLLFI